MSKNESFFQRLSRLFRSGPAIQRRIKGYDSKSYYDSKLVQGNYGYRAPSPFGFGRENSPFSVLGSYGILDRMARYAEFAEMEYTPELASALDIYADETVGGDERGRAFHVYSDNIQIKRALEELFYDVLNVEFNLRAWTRNLVKYGDFFLYNEVLPEIGVINAQPIPVNELEREEGYDEEDPYAVRFKWLTRGNVILENWQVTHFRILGNDLFLPYGTSVLEAGRRIWRQLIMMEDAMLVYRVVRSPERRVFYIDTGNVAPNDIPSYMEAAKASLRSHSVIDRTTGRQDMRYNPLAVDEDYYIPVRGNQSGTKIETLAGGQHVTATEDVQYIQSKLFAAIKVPKPYLNYDENLSCLVGNTKIPLLSGEVRTIEELSKEYKGNPKQFNRWAYSTKLNGKVVSGKIKKVWKTKEVKQIHRITLDNNEIIECTENHPFLLRDGTYLRADELEAGISLMPIYRKVSSKEKGNKLDGYEMVWDNHHQKWNYTHRVIKESNNLQSHVSATKEKVVVVHHKDINKRNNNPNNLLLIGRKQHNKLHKELAVKNLVCEENREKLRRMWLDPTSKLRLNHLEGVNNAWSNKNSKSRKQKLALANKKYNKIAKMQKVLKELRAANEPSYKEIMSYIAAYKNKSLHFSDAVYHFNNSGPRIKRIIAEGSDNKETWVSLKKKFGVKKAKPKNLSIDEIEDYSSVASQHNSVESFCRQIKVSRNFFYSFLKENSIEPKNWFEDNLHSGGRFYNHKIEKIEIVDLEHPISVYDLEIENPENTHNFLIEPGIIVHNSKATLAQEDIRFSRTVTGIQKIIISELNKLAMIHLFSRGFDGEDLVNFTLKLSNPSSIAVQQKLELLANKADVAGSLKDTSLVDERWIQKNVLELTDDDIIAIGKGLYEDKVREVQLDQVAFTSEEESNTTTDPFNPANYQVGGGNVPKGAAEPPPGRGGTDIVGPPPKDGTQFTVDYNQGSSPIKATPFLTRNKKNRRRRVGGGGRDNTANPDFAAMLNPSKNRSLRDVFDSDFLSNPTRRESINPETGELIFESNVTFKREPALSNEMKSLVKNLTSHLKKITLKKEILSEELELDDIQNEAEAALLEFAVSDVANENEPSFIPSISTLKEVTREMDEEETPDDEDSIEFDLD